jgi:lipoprotein-anchoring transpeptidase ErfK/SrfK
VRIVTPRARIPSRFIHAPAHRPVRVSFDRPVAAVAIDGGHRRTLATPRRTVTVAPAKRPLAGSVQVAAAARPWERLSSPVSVGWFVQGKGLRTVASPQPGDKLKPREPIRLTVSEPRARRLADALPAPKDTSGHWRATGPHTLVFRPTGFGYPLGGHVHVALPANLSSPQAHDGALSWQTPAGSTERLQQLLAQLGYLPLRFHASGGEPPSSERGQIDAALHPPAGKFRWRYHHTPSQLKSNWHAGQDNAITKGAIMAYENKAGLDIDGVAGPAVWASLMRDALSGKHANSSGYSFVMVSEASPESLRLWHDGHTVLTTPANTGIPSRPTDPGTFEVYSHLRSTTMSGTNPDGSHYDDPGVPWVSYFNGGDAIHGFRRASYGSAQSLGCVELPYDQAEKVWPYTDIGTVVTVF